MKLKISFIAVMVSLTGFFSTPVLAEDVLEYGIDVSTNYVFRGFDMYEGAADANSKSRAAFSLMPSLQPTVTFSGPAGFSLNLWGAFAATNRGALKGNLKALDELDITLSKSWENKIGSVEAGYVVYTLLDVEAVTGGAGALEEVFFSWGMPWAKSISPTLKYYVDTTSSISYLNLGISGGESLTWGAAAGFVRSAGMQDYTANVGYKLSDSMSLTLNLVNRVNLENVDLDGAADGEYADQGNVGVAAPLPKNLAFLTFTYSGNVKK